MPQHLQTLGLRLSLLHAASFVGIAIYLSFFPVWLASRGMDAATIGFVLAIPMVVRILVTAPLLGLADRSVGPRRLLLACHLAQVVGYTVLALLANNIAIAVMIALLAIVHAPVMPGNDLVTTNAIRDGAPLNYGRVRVWGSISFLCSSILTGYLVDGIGPQVVVWGLAVTPLLGIAATALALPSRSSTTSAATDRPQPRTALPLVLWIVMAAASFTQASHAAIYAFGSIHWRSIGFSDTVIGYLWAVGVLAEIGALVWLGRGVGQGTAALRLIVIGSAATIVRFLLMAADSGPAATFALQALHGLSFGATHLGAIAALTTLAPDRAQGRAQGLYVATVALTMAVMTIASGPLYRVLGSLTFATMAPLGLIGLALTLVAMRMLASRSSERAPVA
jgi:PPP family 3-phenylpropionic acid transporter